MSQYAVRFNYPTVKQEQPPLPGFPAYAAPLWYVPQFVVGHIQVRDSHAATPHWTTLCQAAVLGQRKVVAKHLPGREVCLECLKNYRANPRLPDNLLLKVWSEGGTKAFV